MLPIGKHIDAIIKAALAEPLKTAGFKKQARVFRRVAADGNIEVLDIQSGKYNEGSRGEFTVNLGLYLPAIARMLGEALQEKPTDVHCHFHMRIGHLLPDKQEDFWWQIDECSDDAALAAELQAAVMQHGMAWFAALAPAAFKSARTVPGCHPPFPALPTHNPLVKVSYYLLLDERESARQALHTALEHRPRLRDQLLALAARQGL